ncbi:MAG TPA: rod shape-determining protein MreC [candidate division WOR-3 bacterium]|uniref:Cell shape-determining protein MreC n=1 Tax=candidate division WOR-3 bacterium TaxID=2052148 RepID=A0A7C0XC98_UNCW3|nr:rod shape-determining protein MreC [candidate division WOR-3 bacterium]
MKASQRLIAIFLLLSFLFAIPEVRRITTSYLLRSFYIPLLKAEATVVDFLNIRKEREDLLRELAEARHRAVTEKLELFLEEDTVKTSAIPIAYSPLGVPTKIALDKGKESGIEYGDPVLQKGNLAGKITESMEGSSSFLTLLSDEMKVGVVDTRSGALGVLRGGLEPALLYIPEWADVRPGDTLATSGLGGVFPKAIPVGVIKDMLPSEDPFYRNIRVKLFVDYYRAGSYTVLKK